MINKEPVILTKRQLNYRRNIWRKVAIVIGTSIKPILSAASPFIWQPSIITPCSGSSSNTRMRWR